MQGDRLPRRPALLEVVALEDPGDRDAGSELDEPLGAEGGEPAAVELDDGLAFVQDAKGLLRIGRRVLFDLCTRQLRARALLAGRIADHSREVADHEDHPVARVLEVAHLAQDDRVPEMDVGRRWVEPDFHGQRSAFELSDELLFLDNVHGAAAQQLEIGRAGSHGGSGSYAGARLKER